MRLTAADLEQYRSGCSHRMHHRKLFSPVVKDSEADEYEVNKGGRECSGLVIPAYTEGNEKENRMTCIYNS